MNLGKTNALAVIFWNESCACKIHIPIYLNFFHARDKKNLKFKLDLSCYCFIINKFQPYIKV